jgi:hypothetical protein
MYISKNYPLARGREQDQTKFAKVIYDYILKLISREADRLIEYWRRNVNKYFNRRAYGRYFGSPNTGANISKNIKPFIITSTQMKSKANKPSTHPTPGKSFANTNQLASALKVMNVSVWEAQLYVGRVYAPTNGVDYVQYLINGTSVVQGTPYIPELDKRIHVEDGKWAGITSQYWGRWQKIFEDEIRRSETRLNIEIEEYVKKMKFAEGIYHLLKTTENVPGLTKVRGAAARVAVTMNIPELKVPRGRQRF